MIHWLQPPKSQQVAKYIECYWLLEKQHDTDNHQFPKLNPDPSGHFILSASNQAYHYDLETGVINGEGSHWIFPHCQTFQLDHCQPFIYLGVKFHIGALYSLDMPTYVHPMLDIVKADKLSHLLNNNDACEVDLIDIARDSPSLCCTQLDGLFLPWLEKSKEDMHSELSRKALRLLDSNPISEIGDLLFCSQRTLERSFSRVTGLTMKQCQSMNKLEAMLEYLCQRDADAIDWVEVAYQFAFSDQPHLIRHLKKQLGLTPKNHVDQRNFTIDVYGGVEIP